MWKCCQLPMLPMANLEERADDWERRHLGGAWEAWNVVNCQLGIGNNGNSGNNGNNGNSFTP